MRFKMYFMLGCLMMTASACGGAGGSSSTSSLGTLTQGTGTGENQLSSGEVNAASMRVGDSFTVEDAESNNITLTFSDETQTDDLYLLVLSTPEQTAQSFAYILGSESAASSNALSLKSAGQDEALPAQDMHDFMREIESDLPAQLPQAIQSRAQAMTRQVATRVGDTRTFKVLNTLGSLDSCDTVTAEAVLSNDTFVLYVDEDTELSDDEIEIYASLEEGLRKEIDIAGAPSDIDADGKVNVLITPVVNSLASSGGGFVTGFFDATNLYSTRSYPCSNETEIVFLNAPDPDGDMGNVRISHSFYQNNLQTTVLYHEFQHLINFNQHVLSRGSRAERAALNEALSHFFEGNPGDWSDFGNENPSRVAPFLSAPYAKDLLSGTSLAQRGGSYLFLHYLCAQADLGTLSAVSSCDELIGSLIQSAQSGVDNIESVTGEDFSDLFSNFALAVAINNLGLTDDVRFDFDGLNLYQSWQDNRGTRWDGVSTRSLDSTDGTMSANAIDIIEITGRDIANNDGIVSLNGGAGSLRAHLIRVN